MNTLSQMVPVLLITALVQFIKEAFGLPSKYAQIATFTIAVVFGIIFYLNADITQTVTAVLSYALAAIGLWEVGGGAYSKIRGNTTDTPAPSAIDPEGP